MSTPKLVGHLTNNARSLIEEEVHLARAELREEIRREIRAAVGFTVAGVLATCTLALLLVAAAMGLGTLIAEWNAALIMAGVAALGTAVSAAYGWAKRVTRPLPETRRSVKENVQWARERMH